MLWKRERVTFASGDPFCMKKLLHEGRLEHSVTFARWKFFTAAFLNWILLHDVTFLRWYFCNALFCTITFLQGASICVQADWMFFSQYRIYHKNKWKLKFYKRLISKTKNQKIKVLRGKNYCKKQKKLKEQIQLFKKDSYYGQNIKFI